MGAWGEGITSNDLAQDLKKEYQAAFSHYSVEEALEKLDAYVRSQGITEADQEDWCDYIYSLAAFMWKKGILTDAFREQVISMVDEGFGLEAWRDTGPAALKGRQKALACFRRQLMRPQGEKKKIRLDIYPSSIYESGDLVAFQLQTRKHSYVPDALHGMTEADYLSMDGKWVMVKKLQDCISWQSASVPEIMDHWAVFSLYPEVFDSCPEPTDFEDEILFQCESSLFYFRQRNAKVIGKGIPLRELPDSFYPLANSIHFSVDRPWTSPDSALIGRLLEYRRGRKYRII